MKSSNLFLWGFKKIKIFMLLYVAFTFVSMLVKYIDTLEPVLSGKIIDFLVAMNKQAFLLTLLFMFFLMLINLFISSFSAWCRTKWNNHVLESVEMEFVDSMLSINNPNAFNNKNREDVKNMILSDISNYISFYTGTIPDVLITIFTLFIIGYRLASIKLSLLFIVTFLSSIPIVANLLMASLQKIQKENERVYQNKYLRLVNDYVDGDSEIIINGAKSYFFLLYQKVLKQGLKLIERGTALSIIQAFLNFFANSGASIIIYIILGTMVLNGNISVGNLIAMNLYAHQLKSTIVSISSIWQNYLVSTVSIQRLHNYLSKEKRKNLQETDKTIEISNFCIRYDESQPDIIHDFNFSFPRCGLFIIKGKNGSGKSTLLNSISSSNPEGCIYNGTIKVNKILKISRVFQTPLVLQLSIRDNILFGNNKSDTEIEQVLDLVDMKQAVLSLEKKLDTILLEETSFSQGQIQRIAIARALISDPDVILMDEADSKLDNDVKKDLADLLNDIKKKQLIIFVTHSIVFDEIADGIIVIDRDGL